LLALASHGDLRELAGQAHRLRGLARLAILAHEPAREALLLALELAEQIGSVRLAWACHRALAQVAAALGDGGGQNASEARARSLAEQMGGSLAGSGLVMAQQRPQPGHTPLQ
jgi:hypothetical protein